MKNLPVVAKLALSYKFINELQLNEAIEYQTKEMQAGLNPTLEEILVKQGFLNTDQMVLLNRAKKLLETKQQDKLFAEKGIQKGLLTSEQVDKAFDLQAQLFRKDKSIVSIAKIFVESEILTKEQIELILRDDIPSANEEKLIEPAVIHEAHKSTSLDIIVSEDRLQAMLSIPNDLHKFISLDHVKQLLVQKKISYGFIDDDQIENYIENFSEGCAPLIIAKGKPPITGKDASIQYFFQLDYLHAGLLSDEGTIDYKERGNIPSVKKGTLLAEKIPMIESEIGIDVYGNILQTPPVKDADFRCAQGTEFNEDKLKIIASIDGYPKVLLTGDIAVVSEFHVPGDVGYKTGHVRFEGNIIVRDTIQAGFQVKGVNIYAREVFGGQLEASGNVKIFGGIIRATITAHGDIEATYIKESTIHAYGNLLITREIIDSDIRISGICAIEKGKILSSSISACKGIMARDIGTTVATPCKLRFGVDDHLEKELLDTRVQIADLKKKKEEIKFQQEKLKEEEKVTHDMIAEMASVQDRAITQQKSLEQMLEQFEKKGVKRRLKHVEDKLADIQEQLKISEETMKTLFANQNGFKEKMDELKNQEVQIEIELEALNRKKQLIGDWKNDKKHTPLIRVIGEIVEKTIIFGPMTSLVLRESYRNIEIKEVNQSKDDMPDWKIQVQKKR
ncbi:MAG: DUF342 domain-containing protein [Desulfobacterales bacterium]|nr:DUF342 domain-containing protein [Desulfobacterales bacterium]